jgi:tripartite-type tricarboxylate transporter receptor subunit TctC
VSLTLSSAVLNAFLYRSLPFDVRRDLAAVAEIGRSPNIVGVRRDFPARDVAGLIAHARANPETTTYSSAARARSSTSPPSSSPTWPASGWCTCPSAAAGRRCRR